MYITNEHTLCSPFNDTRQIQQLYVGTFVLELNVYDIYKNIIITIVIIKTEIRYKQRQR